MSELEVFILNLERSLEERYQLCNDGAATPSSILLAVLNAVADARAAMHSARKLRDDHGS
jgi:hypothetical protein